MAYTPISWEDYPSVNTPVSASNLNHMDTQIKANADDIEDIKDDITTLNNNLATIFPSNNYRIESDTTHSDVLEVSVSNPTDIANMPHFIYQRTSGTPLSNMPSDISSGFIGIRFVHFFNVQNVVAEMVQLQPPFSRYYCKWNGSAFGSWYKSTATVVS